MSNEAKQDWAEVLAGPLVAWWRTSVASSTVQNEAVYNACADELLAHLRECGVGELLEVGQLMRERITTLSDEVGASEPVSGMAWDAAKAAMLAKAKLLARGSK